MLVVPHPDGHVAVTQHDHAAMCAELADAWGGERFGQVAPEVRLAAAEHELGWAEWDQNPTLNASTGLPASVMDLELEEYVDFQLAGPRRLAERSPYAALLAVHHHMSFYRPPAITGLLSKRDRTVRSHLARSGAYRSELRAQVEASDERIDREWRLVRYWDALSHDLLHERVPSTRPAPDANGELGELALDRDGRRLEPRALALRRRPAHGPGAGTPAGEHPRRPGVDAPRARAGTVDRAASTSCATPRRSASRCEPAPSRPRPRGPSAAPR